MNNIAEELRDIADKAEAGDKLHWAKAMRAGALQLYNWQRDLETYRLRLDHHDAQSAQLGEVLDDLAGVISQIDNMVCGLPREPILCAAPSSEEVDEVVERLRTYPTRQHLIAADLIERLAARVPDERIATLDRKVAELEQVISEHGADMWAQGEEYAALSAKCAQAQIKADALEQQNAELVAALELCKKHMIGDKWDSLFIDGVLSKVKQP